MNNQKKLELTLCGMLPYGLKIKDKNNKIFVLSAGYNCTEEKSISMQFCFSRNDLVKPLLHSLDKLTEPILEGGLIPIVELAKIASLFDTSKFKFEVGADELGYWCNIIKGGSVQDCMLFDGRLFINNYEMLGSYSYRDIPNQLELFEKLKEWHFNIYDLPKEMYIEKSESNGK